MLISSLSKKLIVVALLLVICVAYYFRAINNVYYFASFQASNCGVNLKSKSEVEFGSIHLQTVTGDDVYFKDFRPGLCHDPIGPDLTTFKVDDKVQIVTDEHNNIIKLKRVHLF